MRVLFEDSLQRREIVVYSALDGTSTWAGVALSGVVLGPTGYHRLGPGEAKPAVMDLMS